MATLDKPMRFTGLTVEDVFRQLIKKEEANVEITTTPDEMSSHSVIINESVNTLTNRYFL